MILLWPSSEPNAHRELHLQPISQPLHDDACPDLGQHLSDMTMDQYAPSVKIAGSANRKLRHRGVVA